MIRHESNPQQKSQEEENPHQIEDESVEIVELSSRQKEILRSTWQIVSRDIGQTLSYVAPSYPSGKGQDDSSSSSVTDDTQEKKDVTEPFLRLFEEYPMSQQFFTEFRGTPVEALKNDAKLASVLQDHAIRVIRVVEKVIGRIEDLEKVQYILWKLLA